MLLVAHISCQLKIATIVSIPVGYCEDLLLTDGSGQYKVANKSGQLVRRRSRNKDANLQDS